MQSALSYIEERLTEELTVEDNARSANSSSANFQRIFSLVTGMTVGGYIRSRRLTLAGMCADIRLFDCLAATSSCIPMLSHTVKWKILVDRWMEPTYHSLIEEVCLKAD
jgi:hypothetical protein